VTRGSLLRRRPRALGRSPVGTLEAGDRELEIGDRRSGAGVLSPAPFPGRAEDTFNWQGRLPQSEAAGPLEGGEGARDAVPPGQLLDGDQTGGGLLVSPEGDDEGSLGDAAAELLDGGDKLEAGGGGEGFAEGLSNREVRASP
jgi:hypothetical protein